MRYDFRDKTVLLTGASMGIGLHFARALSARGATLLLVARSESKLTALARELGNAHVLTADLSAPNAAQDLFDRVTALGLSVDVLINNAGFGLYGPFATHPVSELRAMIDLNVRALVELTALFLPGITARKGGVLNIASGAAYAPIAYMAVYAATKAFVLSFSEALWAECEPLGVRVVCVSPGATETPFFDRAGEGGAHLKKAKPADVVSFALDAFAHNTPSSVHGFGNALMTFSGRFFPRATVARMSARMNQSAARAKP